MYKGQKSLTNFLIPENLTTQISIAKIDIGR